VVVREGKGESRHYVTMSQEMCERLTAGKHTPERCLEATFRCLDAGLAFYAIEAFRTGLTF
jgi:hypothetical protein